jgi:acyl-coenzyme A synthetase/AMP-(fatty) acid ligase
MSWLTLEGALERLPKSRICLIAGNCHFNVGEILQRSRIVRASMVEVRAGNVALSELAPLDLIITLIALDGFAAQILLLPPSLEIDTLESINKQAGTTHIIHADDKQIQKVSDVALDSENGLPTNWLLATSGTTGAPKIISHQLATLTRTVRFDSERGANFIWGLLYDPKRFAGLQVVLQALFSGSTLIVPDRIQFENQREAILSQKVNALSATPTLWRKLLMDKRICQLPLKQLTLGGETVDQMILNSLKRTFPMARIVHIYASTEAGTGFTVRDGCAGFPAEWLNNRCFSPALSVSKEKHLLIKPETLPKGIEVTSRIDVNGYLDTQDLVDVVGDRVLFMGRVSGAINVGGNKLNPEWLESYLRTLPGVADARVYAKKSSIVGQLVAADIVMVENVDPKFMRQDILNQCKSNLENWQVPTFIKFVEELKENVAGKRERLNT